jgi:hypothetical protein
LPNDSSFSSPQVYQASFEQVSPGKLQPVLKPEPANFGICTLLLLPAASGTAVGSVLHGGLMLLFFKWAGSAAAEGVLADAEVMKVRGAAAEAASALMFSAA